MDSPYLVFAAFESLKNNGINIIQNDSIRNAIVDIYELKFAYLIKDYDRAEWNIFTTASLPYFIKNNERPENHPCAYPRKALVKACMYGIRLHNSFAQVIVKDCEF